MIIDGRLIMIISITMIRARILSLLFEAGFVLSATEKGIDCVINRMVCLYGNMLLLSVFVRVSA